MLPVDAELGNPNLLPEQLRTTQVTILDPDVAARSAGALLQEAALAAGQNQCCAEQLVRTGPFANLA